MKDSLIQCVTGNFPHTKRPMGPTMGETYGHDDDESLHVRPRTSPAIWSEDWVVLTVARDLRLRRLRTYSDHGWIFGTIPKSSRGFVIRRGVNEKMTTTASSASLCSGSERLCFGGGL